MNGQNSTELFKNSDKVYVLETAGTSFSIPTRITAFLNSSTLL
jgi:hypothetical protein